MDQNDGAPESLEEAVRIYKARYQIGACKVDTLEDGTITRSWPMIADGHRVTLVIGPAKS